jgi:WXG100 family type VII secretion target
MAERILVSTEQIAQTVSKYESARQTKNSALNAMKSAVDALGSSWNGVASQAFASVFGTLYSNLSSSDAIMEDAITELNKVANLAEETEKKQQQANAALETGEAFQF